MNKEKNVLITGGSQGIGKQTAIEFLKNKYNVIITSRFEQKEKELIEFLKLYGSNVYFYKLDVTDENQVKNVISSITTKFGKLDILINNAGISLSNGLLTESNTSDFEKMIQTNILGSYYCMKHALVYMEKEKSGSIVNISSIAGLRGMPYSVLYGSTKSAIIGLTKGAAIEYAEKNIKINAVAPGIVKTEELQKEIATGEVIESTAATIHPTCTLGTTSDIARGIYFLANENNEFLTGHILNIDGGYTAQ
ncbi:SDR family oxidoreductase [Staphylococcus casei]|uniref:3-oxoacyl-[acyl-carrier-protein] reductase FabG n=1 Tax=Staphylococcus casei TaxID=201828 RepID=A0ABZ2WGK2_9STAP